MMTDNDLYNQDTLAQSAFLYINNPVCTLLNKIFTDNTTRRRKTKAELKEHPDENLQTKKQHEIVEEKKKIAAFASGGKIKNF